MPSFTTSQVGSEEETYNEDDEEEEDEDCSKSGRHQIVSKRNIRKALKMLKSQIFHDDFVFLMKKFG